MPFQPRELFSGVIPFLALVGASTMVPWRRRLRAAGIGLAALFVFHMGLIVLGPYMTGLPQAQLGLVWMRRINRMIDVFYGFYGLVGYAALPFLLWWVLTQRHVPAVDRRARRDPGAALTEGTATAALAGCRPARNSSSSRFTSSGFSCCVQWPQSRTRCVARRFGTQCAHAGGQLGAQHRVELGGDHQRRRQHLGAARDRRWSPSCDRSCGTS